MVSWAKLSALTTHQAVVAARAADPAGDGGPPPGDPVLSHAVRAFWALRALIPARTTRSMPTPSATAPAVTASRMPASRPPFRVSRRASRITGGTLTDPSIH